MVRGAQSDSDLREIFTDPESEGILLETGYSKPLTLIQLNDSKCIVSSLMSLIDYRCVIKVKAAVDQFLDGLRAPGVADYVCKHPELM